MFKRIFFTFLLMSIILGKSISNQDAQQIALNWFSGDGLSKQSRTIDNVQTYQYKNQDALYVVNMTPASFIIMSTNDDVESVLAYSDEDNLDMHDLHPALKNLLENYAARVISQTPVQSKFENTPTTTIPDTIDPFVETKWDQNWPYNKFCPVDSSADPFEVNYRTYAGCVATAMSQIMKFYDYPEIGNSYNTYTHPTYGTQTAHFDTTNYDWENMLNVISQFSKTYQIDAVAELIYHCGVAVNMGYGPDGSGAYSQNVPAAMVDYFNYSTEIDFLSRAAYSDEKWALIIKAELNDHRPIYYSGDNGEAGHAFVCDGYENRAKLGHFFHFNWGWSGSGNGFFSLGAMVLDLNYGHDIIINYAPAGQVPKFTTDVRKALVPATVQFTDLSEGTPTAWEWDFDMDGNVDSYEQNPTWTYTDAGDYTVSLKVHYDSVAYQKTYVEYIDVQSENELYGTISEDRTINADIVKVLGNTLVSSGATLTINPGTKIQFEGNYELKIDGNIQAIGTKEDSIEFTAIPGGWKGINFTGKANDTTSFAYCKFHNVNESTVIKSINNHNLKISNCTFSDNIGIVFGIWFHNQNRFIINKCLFENNTNHQEGLFDSWATVFTGFLADGDITNSIIRNNGMSKNGAIFISNTSDVAFINNTIVENYHQEILPSIIRVSASSNLDLVNTILWNERFEEINFEGTNTTSIRNCDIQNGMQAINGSAPTFTHYSGILNVDPQFLDNTLELSSQSPCIDHGIVISDSNYADSLDFYGSPRFAGNHIDIGATESEFVYESGAIGFTADILSGEFPLSVKFTDTTLVDNIISLKWDFENDGQWDALDSVEITHIYDRPGVYSVSMLAMTADSTPVFILADSLITVSGETTDIVEHEFLPSEFYLNQNYPNPFNPTTTISYGLPKLSMVKISIYNILGEKVKVLTNEMKPAGNYQIVWNGKNEQGVTVTSGIYLYQLQCGNYINTQKMFFVK